jgi:MFS family permease
MTDRPSPFRPFRHAGFRGLWIGVQVSNVGTMIQNVGVAWAMTLMTTSPTLIALVQASTLLPLMLFAMMSGVMADSRDRLRVILLAQTIMVLASAVLAVVAFAGALTPWLLLALTFLIGSGTALHNPSWQASVGDLVPRAELPEAVTLNAMGFNMSRSVGPAAGGVVVAALGAPWAFVINTLSYLPLLATLAFGRPARIEGTVPRPARPEPMLSALGAGLRYFAMSPNIVRVTLRAALFGIGAIALHALLPLVAAVQLGGGSTLYGVLLAGFGLGAIGGALLNPILRARLRNERIVELAHGVFAASMLAVSQSPWLAVSLLAMVPAGMSWLMAMSLHNVSVQLAAPRWVAGRVLSIYQTALFGGMALGAWLWGSVADALGVPLALAIAAGLMLLGMLAGLAFPVPDFSNADLTPVGNVRQPNLRLDLRGRSGPIMIMIDYNIDQQDVPQFLALMAERRQSRRRAGARNWALLRDLEVPETWSESFHLATWDDYLRHMERRTTADTEIADRLRALHRGDGAPRVHRMIERHSVPPADDLPLRDPPA